MPINKVDLDTVQPNGKLGEPQRSAFGKINSNYDFISGQIAGLTTGVGAAATAAQLNAEITARQATDTLVATKAASADLTSATNTLNTAIGLRATTEQLNTEITNRTNADTALGTRISTEVTDRTNADSALSTRITTAQSKADAALPKAGGVVSGTLTVNAEFLTSSKIQAGTGYATRPGTSGQVGTNQFNFSWGNAEMHGWVDATDLGKVNFTASDYRIKEDVRYVASGDLDRVMQGKPCYWRYTPDSIWYDGGKLHRSFIAHELQAVDETLAYGEKDATYGENQVKMQGLELMSIVSVLWGALQEECKARKALETRLEALEKE